MIYPNPAKNVSYIESSEPIDSYQLLDLTGKTITSEKNSNKVNVSSVNPGLYLLKLQSNNDITTKKVVIQ